MAFNSGVTIYPTVSDASSGVPTTIFPYYMRAEDAPVSPFARGRSVLRTYTGDASSYRVYVQGKITSLGGYSAWLSYLESKIPTTVSIIPATIGGTVNEWKVARAKAQRAYDEAQGVNTGITSPTVSSSEPGSLGAALDAAGDAASDAASSVQTYVMQHPGKAVAWVVGAGVVVYLLARSGRR